MKETSLQLGGRREHTLFAHAWTGCDTVSAPYGKGKQGFWDLLKNSEDLDDLSLTMNDVWAIREVKMLLKLPFAKCMVVMVMKACYN